MRDSLHPERGHGIACYTVNCNEEASLVIVRSYTEPSRWFVARYQPQAKENDVLFPAASEQEAREWMAENSPWDDGARRRASTDEFSVL
jgi:hypothetical protein